jgi:hypothetical protein
MVCFFDLQFTTCCECITAIAENNVTGMSQGSPLFTSISKRIAFAARAWGFCTWRHVSDAGCATTTRFERPIVLAVVVSERFAPPAIPAGRIEPILRSLMRLSRASIATTPRACSHRPWRCTRPPCTGHQCQRDAQWKRRVKPSVMVRSAEENLAPQLRSTNLSILFVNKIDTQRSSKVPRRLKTFTNSLWYKRCSNYIHQLGGCTNEQIESLSRSRNWPFRSPAIRNGCLGDTALWR